MADQISGQINHHETGPARILLNRAGNGPGAQDQGRLLPACQGYETTMAFIENLVEI